MKLGCMVTRSKRLRQGGSVWFAMILFNGGACLWGHGRFKSDHFRFASRNIQNLIFHCYQKLTQANLYELNIIRQIIVLRQLGFSSNRIRAFVTKTYEIRNLTWWKLKQKEKHVCRCEIFKRTFKGPKIQVKISKRGFKNYKHPILYHYLILSAF